MIKMLKTELRRAFLSKGMLASLAVGIGIVLWHQYSYIWNSNIEMKNEFCMESLYYNWIGASCAPMQSYLYYLILPILAVLPAGILYHEDLHTGYYRNIFIRNRKKEYLLAKYISVFLSGGTAVVLPLFLSLSLTAMRFPALLPEPIMDYGPNRSSIGFHLFYEHPLIYTFLFLGIDFVFAGGIAGISCLASFFTEYKFAVLITPFVCYYLLFSLDNIISEDTFAPNYFLIPGFDSNNIGEFIIGIFVLALVALLYVWKGQRRE